MALVSRGSSQVAAALSGAPPSPPAGLLFEANFQTASYQLNGSAAVVGDLFVQSDYGPFNPATDITASGLVDGYPALSADLFTAFESGLTFVLDADFSGNTSQVSFDSVDPPAYSSSGGGYVKLLNWNIYDQVGLNANQVAALSAGVHRTALNFSPSRVALSVDGSAIFASDISTVGLNTTVFSVVAAAIQTMNGRALVSESELPTLSTP